MADIGKVTCHYFHNQYLLIMNLTMAENDLFTPGH